MNVFEFGIGGVLFCCGCCCLLILMVLLLDLFWGGLFCLLICVFSEGNVLFIWFVFCFTGCLCIWLIVLLFVYMVLYVCVFCFGTWYCYFVEIDCCSCLLVRFGLWVMIGWLSILDVEWLIWFAFITCMFYWVVRFWVCYTDVGWLVGNLFWLFAC